MREGDTKLERVFTPGMKRRAVAIIAPHSGEGGCAPIPRNPSAAAVRLESPEESGKNSLNRPKEARRLNTVDGDAMCVNSAI